MINNIKNNDRIFKIKIFPLPLKSIYEGVEALKIPIGRLARVGYIQDDIILTTTVDIGDIVMRQNSVKFPFRVIYRKSNKSLYPVYNDIHKIGQELWGITLEILTDGIDKYLPYQYRTVFDSNRPLE